jgi:dsDNA-specific endonuclease/ATPase MutS2
MKKQKKRSAPTLDLHGRRVEEVFDLVDSFIQKHANKPRICIMPGKGTGKVKSEVLRYLKLGGYPWEYDTLSDGRKNTGSLVVIMD